MDIMAIHSIDDIKESLGKYFKELEYYQDIYINGIVDYKKKYKELSKDNIIIELKQKIEELENKIADSSFLISDEEAAAIDMWVKQHIEEKHDGNSYIGPIGGMFSYIFTPTTIGEIGEIKCRCGDKFCFRDLK